MGLAEKIYLELKSKGVEIGNASILIINKILEEAPTCSPTERAFLDEIRELYEWNDHLGFPHLQRKKITKFSNIYQQDFKKCNLKDLVNEHT